MFRCSVAACNIGKQEHGVKLFDTFANLIVWTTISLILVLYILNKLHTKIVLCNFLPAGSYLKSNLHVSTTQNQEHMGIICLPSNPQEPVQSEAIRASL